MTVDEIALAKISESMLVRTFALAQSDDQFGIKIQKAVDADHTAVAVAQSEGEKLQQIADQVGADPGGPLLALLDPGSQANIAPSMIKLGEAFAGAMIAAKVEPSILARIVPLQERTASNSSAFAAHGNTNLAKLFSPA